MLKLFNSGGEVSARGDYSNPVHFDLDARFSDEVVQMLTLSCANGCTARNVTLTDSGDTADRYFFSINGTSWADSVNFAAITDNTACYIKARTVADETADTYRDAKLVLTYELQPAVTPAFYYTNPGDADLLAVEDATTLDVTPDKSVTGKAFYGGQLADMFHTPADLTEVWIRLDIWMPTYNYNYHKFNIGLYRSSNTDFIGVYYVYPSSCLELHNGTKKCETLSVIRDALNTVTLHIKSGELVEMTADGTTVSWAGDVNGGAPLNNLVTRSAANDILFSNVVVSSGDIDSACGWHRDIFSLETVIAAPVLNVRYQGAVNKFPITTKKTTPALTVRVGDRNFYAPLVEGSSSLASAVRLNLNDTIYALKT